MLDYVILGVLATRRLSGYDISRWMEGPGRYLGYGVKSPQIYRKLATLVERGWVRYEVDPREGRPDAKVYHLTEDGRQTLLDWARSPHQPSTRPADPDFTIRLLFAGQLDPAIALDIVTTELDYRVKHDGLFPAFPYDDKIEPQIPELDPAWARDVQIMTHEQGYTSVHHYITWLRLTKARLERRLDR